MARPFHPPIHQIRTRQARRHQPLLPHLKRRRLLALKFFHQRLQSLPPRQRRPMCPQCRALHPSAVRARAPGSQLRHQPRPLRHPLAHPCSARTRPGRCRRLGQCGCTGVGTGSSLGCSASADVLWVACTAQLVTAIVYFFTHTCCSLAFCMLCAGSASAALWALCSRQWDLSRRHCCRPLARVCQQRQQQLST